MNIRIPLAAAVQSTTTTIKKIHKTAHTERDRERERERESERERERRRAS